MSTENRVVKAKTNKKPPRFLRKVYLSERELEFLISKISLTEEERGAQSWKTKMLNKLVSHHVKSKESREKNNK